MNRIEANQIRASIGLAPLPTVEHNTARKRADANKATRAQASRDLKAKRASGKR
jgi:hypothetical protein